MQRILLINPPSSVAIYNRSKITAAVPHVPAQALACVAANLLPHGFKVEIADLILEKKPYDILKDKLETFVPHLVGITFTTPLYDEGKRIVSIVKSWKKDTVVVLGGVHVTGLPEATLQDMKADIAVIGEGDTTLLDILATDDRSKVNGICYSNGREFVRTPPRPLIQDLDSLPFPAWQLYPIEMYKTSRITSRRNPVGGIITSRGCPYPCTFCTKNLFGSRIRVKSPEYVVNEMAYLLELGFKEIHVLDDLFVADMPRAKKICELILKRGLSFTWNLFSGIRVDTVDKEFLDMAREAGCYTISYGVESGNEALLKQIGKRFTREDCRRAFQLTRKAGLESVGFFMFGLPGETESTMDETIRFAIELDPDYAKVTTLLPYPCTTLFDSLEREGRILSKDWSQYNFHCTSDIWKHPNLSWETLRSYYDKFYRRFYIRPFYILRRLRRGLFNGGVFRDAYYAFQNFFK